MLTKQDAIDSLITAAHNYAQDKSNWNGDESDAEERMEERLADAVASVLDNISINES